MQENRRDAASTFSMWVEKDRKAREEKDEVYKAEEVIRAKEVGEAVGTKHAN